jgi:hypothetical protein
MKTYKSLLLTLILSACVSVPSWATFPTTLTNAVDGETEILASHLNNLEDKVGVNNSSVTTSLDYMLRSGSSIDPGHKHTPPYGGTGIYTYVLGDLLYASSSAVLSRLADVGAGSYLRSGGIAAAPLWSTLILPNAATAYRLPVATASNTIGELAAVGATGQYLKGNTGAIPSWDTLNQAAVAGLTTADGPTFAHLHISDLAAITTAAESWVGPSVSAGIYFKGGNFGLGVSAFGTTMAGGYGMASGTAPTTFPADMAQFVVKDQAAGNACFHFYTELGQTIKLYQQANIAAAKTDYTTGDLDSEAEIIAALNTTNTKLNAILTILQNNGLMAAP